MSAGEHTRRLAAGPERELIDRERDRPDLEPLLPMAPKRVAPKIVRSSGRHVGDQED
jgi:hypothetical protein